MKNYICIDGNKAELTPEQLKALGLETETNPFEKNAYNVFHYINGEGMVTSDRDANTVFDKRLHDVANYCTDKEMMEQRALHETLDRLLWRYSMEHKGNEIDWCDRNRLKYEIYYDHSEQKWNTSGYYTIDPIGTPHFTTKEIAKNAIKEIIEPFMAKHPDFKL
jgi:hypothetical protein